MRADRLTWVVACVIVLAACGARQSEEPLPSPSAVPEPPTTATTTSLPASTTIPTTTTTTTVPAYADPTLFAVPDLPGLLDARPKEEIPWEETAGPGWLALTYWPEHAEQSWEGPQALYLMDADGTFYEVGAWHGPGASVDDWSALHRSILAVDQAGLWRVDLVTGEATLLVDHPTVGGDFMTARFVEPDDELIALRTGSLEASDALQATLDLIDGSGMSITTLSDTVTTAPMWTEQPTTEEALAAASAVPGGVTWVSLPDGSGIVLSDADGVRLVDLTGGTVRRYEAPGLGCEVTRVMGEAVLVSCVDPAYVTMGCYSMWGRDGHAALWSLLIDGSPAEEVYVPPLPPGGDDCWSGRYLDAVPESEGSDTYLYELGGCCECGGSLELSIAGASPVGLLDVTQCEPDLVGGRSGGWLVGDGTGYTGFLYVLEADGTVTYLTPQIAGFGGAGGVWRATESVMWD